MKVNYKEFIMLDYTLISTNFCLEEEEVSLTTILELGFEYILKVYILIGEESKDKFSECDVKITNLSGKKDEFFHHKFLNNCNVRFECDNIKPIIENYCLCELFYTFPKCPHDPGILIDTNILKIDNKLIDSLVTSTNRRKELYDIIDRFVNEDYKGTVGDVGIFGEYIAREFAKKAKRKNYKDFGSAVDALTHHKMSQRSKINYVYIGSLLWPLYYIRNQKLHPYQKIEFNAELAEFTIKCLAEIIKYLGVNNIPF